MKVRLSVPCQHKNGDEKVFSITVLFRDIDHFEEYESNLYDNLIQEINEILPVGWCVDDMIDTDEIDTKDKVQLIVTK